MPKTLPMPRTSRVSLTDSEVPATSPNKSTKPAVVDSKDTDVAADVAYQNLVDTAAKAVNEGNSSSLEYAYVLGEQIEELQASPNKYGGAKVEQFAKDLAGKTGHRISTSILYKYGSLAKTFNRNDLRHMIAKRYALRNIMFLCETRVTDTFRKELLGRVDAGEISQDKLKDAVQDKLGISSKKAKRSKSPTVIIDTVSSMSKSLREKVTDIDPVVEKFKGMKAPARDAFKEQTLAAIEELKELQRVIAAKIKALVEVKFT